MLQEKTMKTFLLCLFVFAIGALAQEEEPEESGMGLSSKQQNSTCTPLRLVYQ